MNYDKLPEWRLWLRTLLPSPTSLTVSFVIAVVVVGFHLFLLSGDPNLILPHLAGSQPDDQLVQSYSSIVQEPLDRTFGSGPLGVLSTAFVWGVIGWILYAVIDFILIMAKEFRSDSGQVSVPDINKIIKHPLHRQLSVRMLWRFTVGLLLIVATVALQPFISRLFQYDIDLLTTSSMWEMVRLIISIVLGWMALLHLYVVLFRLFVLRTRLFGEIIY